MKKLFICLLAMGAMLSAGAQSLESINKLLERNKVAEAKEQIDKAMLVEKNAKNSEYWYYKGRVYNNYSYDSTLSAETRLQLKKDAFEAFKKTQELDAKDLRLKLESYQSYLDLYYGMMTLGSEYFGNKQFDKSAQTFIDALDLHAYIYQKGYNYDNVKFGPIDTTMILNVGIAALQAKDEELANTYFQKLADANVSGKNYEVVYESLANYYNEKNDAENLNKILEKGKKFYPTNAFIRDIELKKLSESGNQDKVFEGYESMMQADPGNFATVYNYSIELYNFIYVNDNKPANVDKYREKLTELLEEAIILDKEINSTMLMANHLYNSGVDYMAAHDQVEGTKADAVQKRKDLKAKAMQYFDQCIPYAQKVLKHYDGQDKLTSSQKAQRVNVLSLLSDTYLYKGDEKKSSEYENLKLKGL